MLTPRRRRGVEILDDPNVDPEIRRQSIDDVTRSNRVLGGARAATRTLRDAAASAQTLLDVGTGLADIPLRFKQANPYITTIGVDEAASLLVAAGDRLDLKVCADARALPFRNHSVDAVMCSQLLHHFEEADAIRVLKELHRVARRTVVVSDLARSWFAAAGFWLVSWLLRFHRVTRHDGVVSVMRGFTERELRALVRRATGREPQIELHLPYRLTAHWKVGGGA